MKPPLIVLLATAFAVGVGVASVSEPPVEWWLLCLVMSAGVGVVWRKNCGAIFAPDLLTISLLFVALALGGLRTEWHQSQFDVSPLVSQVETVVTLAGVVVREPDLRETNQHLYVAVADDIILVSTDRYQSVRYGDLVEVSGTLTTPDTFTTDLGRTFNYPGYLLARGVEYRISFADVVVQEHGYGHSVLAALLTLKQWFITQVDSVIPEPSAGLGKGLLLGVKSALGDQIESDFRRTGIIHIVVLSGYNVMLVAAFMLFCLSFLLPFRWRIVGGIAAITAFALIVGLSATVVRASVMAGLVLLSQFFGRRYDVLRALFFAGAVMLAINPYLLVYDIGFQLSFMATLGLLLLVPEFESTMLQKHTWWVSLRGFLLATIATQVAVLPLLMYHIGEVSLIAVVVNVLVLPVVPLAMLLTFLAGIAHPLIPAVAGMIGYLAWLTLSYILTVAAGFAALPFAAITIPPIPPWLVTAMYAALGYGWYCWRVREEVVVDSLTGWTIVTEADMLQQQTRKTKSGGEHSSPPPNHGTDLPVFFR